MTRVGFETATPVVERLKTVRGLDGAAIRTGTFGIITLKSCITHTKAYDRNYPKSIQSNPLHDSLFTSEHFQYYIVLRLAISYIPDDRYEVFTAVNIRDLGCDLV
jgi:hypothetical protein